MFVSKKKLAWTAVGIVALHLLLAGARLLQSITGHPPNNYFETLKLHGYSEIGVIEDLAGTTLDHSGGWNGSSVQTRVLLAQKAGETHLVSLSRDDTGKWRMGQEPKLLEGEFEGLERLYFYGQYVEGSHGGIPLRRCDWFYYGSNGLKDIEIPQEALPQDATVQIYQRNSQEYALHFTAYLKSNDYWDGGFIEVYQALKENGCVE